MKCVLKIWLKNILHLYFIKKKQKNKNKQNKPKNQWCRYTEKVIMHSDFFLGLVHYCFCWYSYKTLYLLLSYLSKLGKIGDLPVSNLILKLYAFDIFFIWVISLTGNKMVPVPCKSNGKDKEFEYQYKFLKIYIDMWTL